MISRKTQKRKETKETFSSSPLIPQSLSLYSVVEYIGTHLGDKMSEMTSLLPTMLPMAGSDHRWNPQGNKSVSSLPCSKNGCSIQPRNTPERYIYVHTSLFQKAWTFIKHLRMVSVIRGSYNYLVKLLDSCASQPWLCTRITQGVFKDFY